jgi:hypothetical protein
MYNDKSESNRPVFDESLDACDPKNFEDFEDEKVIRF